MRAAAVWYKVVLRVGDGRKRQIGQISLERGHRERCMHDGAMMERLAARVFDASESYEHARRAGRVGYIDVTVRGSKKLRLPVPV